MELPATTKQQHILPLSYCHVPATVTTEQRSTTAMSLHVMGVMYRSLTERDTVKFDTITPARVSEGHAGAEQASYLSHLHSSNTTPTTTKPNSTR
jgi:hypothetical protein